jgi:hypothetical protein
LSHSASPWGLFKPWPFRNFTSFFFLFFGNKGIWTQGFLLTRQGLYCLSHTPSFSSLLIFDSHFIWTHNHCVGIVFLFSYWHLGIFW